MISSNLEKKTNRKRTGESVTSNKNIQPWYNGIWHLKMCQAHNEKREKRNHGKKRTDKSGKHLNAWREGKLQVFGNIGSGHHQTSRDKRKKGKKRKKWVPRKD